MMAKAKWKKWNWNANAAKQRDKGQEEHDGMEDGRREEWIYEKTMMGIRIRRMRRWYLRRRKILESRMPQD